MPCSCLAEEIAEPGEGQIKGLFTIAANPTISVPDSAKLEEALPLLECMIAIDNYLNETSRFAHVILPGVSPLESPHMDEIIWGWATRSAIKWSDALYALAPGQPAEWEILTRLGHYCGGGTDGDYDQSKPRRRLVPCAVPHAGRRPRRSLTEYDHGGPERMIDLSIRMGPWGDRYGQNPDGLNLAKVKAHPEGSTSDRWCHAPTRWCAPHQARSS